MIGVVILVYITCFYLLRPMVYVTRYKCKWLIPLTDLRMLMTLVPLIKKSLLHYRKSKDISFLIKARLFMFFTLHFVLSFELATVRMMLWGIISCILVDAPNILAEHRAFLFRPHRWANCLAAYTIPCCCC